MWEWLLSSIDASRGHEVGFYLSWHARLMTLAWGVIIPSAVVVARYYKILPHQNWPQDLDNPTWWRGHWIGQSFAFTLSIIGLALILVSDESSISEPVYFQAQLHRVLGYVVLVLGALQILLGVFRGTKGGPTDPRKDGSWHGDHYDMTPYRLHFELFHRSMGYLALILAGLTILCGLWTANAPRWMWIGIVGWWIFLFGFSIILQRKGYAVDTYQAIWGPSAKHPGNLRPASGWGTRRPSEGKGTPFDIQLESLDGGEN